MKKVLLFMIVAASGTVDVLSSPFAASALPGALIRLNDTIAVPTAHW